MINFIFGMQMNIEVFYNLILKFWLIIIRYAQSTQNKFAYLCSISRKAWVKKLIFFFFCLQINTKNFYRLIVSLQVCKFTISLQYLKEKINDKVDCCLLMIVEGFFKVILSFQMRVARHAQITQNKKFAISRQYLKKEVMTKLIFCTQVSMKT